MKGEAQAFYSEGDWGRTSDGICRRALIRKSLKYSGLCASMKNILKHYVSVHSPSSRLTEWGQNRWLRNLS